MKSVNPKISVLCKEEIDLIIDNAINILSDIGIFVGCDEAISLLKEYNGIRVSNNRIVTIKADIVERCLESVPSGFTIHPEDGLEALQIGGDNVHFVADSVGKGIIDRKTRKVRKAISKDLVEHINVLNKCQYIDFQSGALLCADIPKELTNTYRWYLSLLYSPKPIFAGFWSKEDFFIIKDMLMVFAGGEVELRERPRAVHGLNPSSPLGLTDTVSYHLINAAKAMLPVMLVPIPLAGGSSPVTLAGTLAQHTAENLGALVINQLANPGAPLLFGGGASVMDMRKGTAVQASVEASLLSCATAEIGKYLALPTASNVGRADSKLEDFQAGQESSTGLILAALSGINMIRGSGALEYMNLISLEKLVLDNEICGNAKRLLRGITINDDSLAFNTIKEIAHSDNSYMGADHTLKWFRSELYLPSKVIDRSTRREFEENLSKNAQERAGDLIDTILDNYEPRQIDKEKKKELDKIMLNHAKKYGMNKLPISEIN